MKPIIWLGITFCITQSAMFSGLNLAFFSISKLNLEIEASQGNKRAKKILHYRKDSNFLLTTILWGNVGINVLLTILSNSVMTGVMAFLFSTFLITFLGEIIPQAYFSRHALKMAYLLAPVLRMYQILLYPITKSSAFLLDKWLGSEAVQYFHENELEALIKMHIRSKESDIDKLEGKGALNFLALDDLILSEEGELMDPRSILQLEFQNNRPVFPKIAPIPTDSFLKKLETSDKKWLVITDAGDQEPKMALDSDGFLRGALFKKTFNPYYYCHRPIVVKDPQTSLGEIIPLFKVHPQRSDDDVIDQDVIIFWGHEKRVITGADILGRLMRGIVKQENKSSQRISNTQGDKRGTTK